MRYLTSPNRSWWMHTTMSREPDTNRAMTTPSFVRVIIEIPSSSLISTSSRPFLIDCVLTRRPILEIRTPAANSSCSTVNSLSGGPEWAPQLTIGPRSRPNNYSVCLILVSGLAPDRHHCSFHALSFPPSTFLSPYPLCQHLPRCRDWRKCQHLVHWQPWPLCSRTSRTTNLEQMDGEWSAKGAQAAYNQRDYIHMVSGFFRRYNTICLPTMHPTPGEDTLVNEELQDHSPSLL